LNTVFRPARAIEEKIPPYDATTNGYIWFAVDTGRIYLDTSTERVMVGSNGVAVLYGEFPKAAEPNEEGKYEFSIEDLAEGSSKPHINDLVLNSDGAFYKILEINGTQLICQQLAVSGGGNGTITPSGSRTSLKIIDPPNKFLINGQEITVEFIASAEKDSEGNYTDEDVDITWTLEEAVGNGIY